MGNNVWKNLVDRMRLSRRINNSQWQEFPPPDQPEGGNPATGSGGFRYLEEAPPSEPAFPGIPKPVDPWTLKTSMGVPEAPPIPPPVGDISTGPVTLAG